MPSNMENYPFELETNEERDLMEREERCRKAMKTVSKAIAMRILICALLIWIVIRSGLDLWVSAMLLLVMIINITGILPLTAEWTKRRQEWKELLEEEE